MFSFLKKIYRNQNGQKQSNSRREAAQFDPVYSDNELKAIPVSADIKENLDLIRSVIGRSYDLVVREFQIPVEPDLGAAVIFLDDRVERTVINQNILRPLMLDLPKLVQSKKEGNQPDLIRFLVDKVLAITEVEILDNFDRIILDVLAGAAMLLVDGESRAISISIKKFPHRDVPTTETENVVRGPKDAFTEVMTVNVALVRQRLLDPNLVVEDMTIGTVTRTGVVLAYVKGIVQPDLVTEVKKRLSRIKIDGILEGGYLEEFIQDNPYTPFPQIGNTERPDRVVSALLQGRVAVFTDGTPFVMWMPARFGDLLQAPEDYYQRFIFATAIRWLRYIGLLFSLVLPSFYVAATTFHQEMIPTRLIISIAAAREGVPFPAVVEALIMEATFEALREAGIRLPRAVGQAISIVGALVIGQAAVSAGIVSPLMVIVVAITGVSSFMFPTYSVGLTIRVLRFPLMLLSATLGLFGLMTGLLLMLIHMLSLRSFGAPYLSPLAPTEPSELKDVLVRTPWWDMDTRPREFVKDNWVRQSPGLKPEPPDGGKQGGKNDPKRNR